MADNPTLAAARDRMVREQLRRRGITDARVLRAMGQVRRETFVAPDLADLAYEDGPLPIDGGQTISQPYMVAAMIEAASIGPGDRVLDIGTGSGYAAAVLGRIAAEVFSIERQAALHAAAKDRLADEPGRIRLRHGDGHAGWLEAAPFDAILIAAACPVVPPALKRQLAVGGRLIAPLGERDLQHLVRLTREAKDAYADERLAPVLFVPLVGGITT